MNNITLILSYYNNPGLLRKQIYCWRDYPEFVKVIVVDDGSKDESLAKELLQEAIRTNINIDVQLYRINEDLPDNTIGARNLGFWMADEGWVLCTDMDHLVPGSVMKELGKRTLRSNCYYGFGRLDQTHIRKIHSHLDTFLIQRNLFNEAGGYDERLRQYYYDGPWAYFRRRLNRRAKKKHIEDLNIICLSSFQHSNGIERKTFKGKLSGPPKSLQFDWEGVFLDKRYLQV